jgi:hypothetical protein
VHICAQWTSGLTLVIFSFFFFFLFILLIFHTLSSKFLQQLFNLFSFRFGICSFYYYLFYLKQFIKVKCFFNSSSNFSSVKFGFYFLIAICFVFNHFNNWICFLVSSLNILFHFIFMSILIFIVLNLFILKLCFSISSFNILLIDNLTSWFF